jgi:hypothetical protein
MILYLFLLSLPFYYLLLPFSLVSRMRFARMSEELKLYNRWFKLWQCPTLVWKCMFFSNASSDGSMFVFQGDNWGVLKDVVKTYQMSPMSPLNFFIFLTLFLCVCRLLVHQ